MKCTIRGCPGEYERKTILHTVRRDQEVFVLENVPADVCSVCGDTLLEPDTVQRIEALFLKKTEPKKFVPMYEYA